MKNVTGPPAGGGNYFGRPSVMEQLRDKIDNGMSVLFTAPRRTGKTSVVQRLCQEYCQRGWVATWIDVEGCHDEIAFLAKIIDGLKQQNLNPQAMAQAATLLQNARQAVGNLHVGAFGVVIQTSEARDSERQTLGNALLSTFRKVATEQRDVLICLDELPQMLINLSEVEDGEARLIALLHWLRDLRQSDGIRIRWVFLGSIGLDNFVATRNINYIINDLSCVGLDAPTEAEAEDFLSQLCQSYNLPLSSDLCHYIIRRLGWPLLYHLQLIFHTLRHLNRSSIDQAVIEEAFELLLSPPSYQYYRTWKERLRKQLTVTLAGIAADTLSYLSKYPDGRERSQILNALMVTRPHSDARVVNSQLSDMLALLQIDGYLLRRADVYSFRSFLIREYWYRTEI